MLRLCVMLMAVLAFVLPAAREASSEPAPTDLLFKARQMDMVGRGAAVTYKFERKVSDEKLLGAQFADDVRVGVLKVNEKGEREVTLNVFTGERAQETQNYPDLTINPIFLWYLDRTIKNLTGVAGGDGNYFKGRFRASFDDKGKAELIKTDFGGKQVTAYKVTIVPFLNDPYAPRMRGYHKSNFEVVVSDEVPGYFLEMRMTIESPNKGSPRIEERLALVGLGEVK